MKVTIILIFLLTSIRLNAQTIFDIYLQLPDKVAIGTASERKQMINNFKNGNKSMDKIHSRFDIADEKNGFLSVTGLFEGLWEMCYWNLSGEKLVAVYFQGCGGVSYIERFDFYSYQKGKLSMVDIETVIPDYKSIYKDFYIEYSEKLKTELENKDIIATLLFKLPRKGKDILVLFGNEDSNETYRKYFKGDRMTLKWINGKFVKGNIYWSN